VVIRSIDFVEGILGIIN